MTRGHGTKVRIIILLSAWYSLDWDLQLIKGAWPRDGLQTSSRLFRLTCPDKLWDVGSSKVWRESTALEEQGSISSGTRLGGGTEKRDAMALCS